MILRCPPSDVLPDALSMYAEFCAAVVEPATLLLLILRSPACHVLPDLSIIAFGCATVPVPTTVNLPSLSTVSRVAGKVSPLTILN